MMATRYRRKKTRIEVEELKTLKDLNIEPNLLKTIKNLAMKHYLFYSDRREVDFKNNKNNSICQTIRDLFDLTFEDFEKVIEEHYEEEQKK